MRLLRFLLAALLMAALPIQGASAAAMKLCLSAAMGHGPAMAASAEARSDAVLAHGGSHGESRGEKGKEKSKDAKDKASQGGKQSLVSPDSPSLDERVAHGDGHGDKSKGKGGDAKDGEGKGKQDGKSADLIHPCAASPACGGAAMSGAPGGLPSLDDGAGKASAGPSRFATRIPSGLERPPRA